MKEEKKQVADKYNPPEEIKEKVRALITDLLKKNNVSVPKLAELMSEKYGRSDSRTNLLNKLARGSFKLSEVIEIAELFNCEVRIEKKEPKEPDKVNENPKK